MRLEKTDIKPVISVSLYNHTTNKSKGVTAMLDTGSDSFIWCKGESLLQKLGFIEEKETVILAGFNNSEKDKSNIKPSKIYSGTIYIKDIVNPESKIILPRIKVAISNANRSLFDMIIPYTFLHQFDFVFKSCFKDAKYGSFGVFTKSDKMVYDVKQSRALVLDVCECTTIPEEVRELIE